METKESKEFSLFREMNKLFFKTKVFPLFYSLESAQNKNNLNISNKGKGSAYSVPNSEWVGISLI